MLLNMGIKGFLTFLLLLLVIGIVFAQTNEELPQSVKIKRDEGEDINQIGSEVAIPPGENATAYLPMFSKSYIRIYEGTKLDFYIVDPDTNAIVIRNSLILNKVSPLSSDVLLSLDSSEYNLKTLAAGDKYRVNYSYNFTPYIDITQLITHYEEESSKENNIVLYFLVPFPKTAKSDFSEVKGQLPIDISRIKPVSRTSSEKRASSVLSIIGIIFGLIIIIAIIFAIKKRIMKLRQH